MVAVRCRCLGRVEVATVPWYGSDEAMCIVALTRLSWAAPGASGLVCPIQTLVVLRPVTVEAMTTSTAATAIAISQRTQSIPGLPLPPKAL